MRVRNRAMNRLRSQMPEIVIRRAETQAGFDAARALSFEWARNHSAEFPQYRKIVETEFEPETYRETVANLHIQHARPEGAILLAELDGQPVGCVMYKKWEPGVAEVKRLFVDENGRGHGLGRALLDQMFHEMVADGYTRAIFSSVRFLTHARALYESAGFSEIPQPVELPEHLRDAVYFMDRALPPD